MRSRALLLALLTIAPGVAACQLLWSYDDYKDAPISTTTSAATGVAPLTIAVMRPAPPNAPAAIARGRNGG